MTKKTTTQTSEAVNPWSIARDHVLSLGRIPPVFTLAVRSLMSDHNKGIDALSPASMFLVNRLMLSPTMKSVIYHAVLTYHGETVANTPHLTSADLVRMFSSADLASIIGTAYFFRTFKRKLNSGTDESAWSDLSRRVLDDMDLGGFVGYCIPSITAGIGILSGSLLSIAQGLFLSIDRQPAEKYISRLALEGHKPDFNYELETWGCTSAQIAGSMLQQIGFGMPWMNAVITSYATNESPPVFKASKDNSLNQFKFALFWIESLRCTGDAPQVKVHADFYPLKQDLLRILYLTGQLAEKGSRYKWASRGKEDISPAHTPQLYQEYLAETASSEELQEFCRSQISSDVLEGIDEADFEKLSTHEPGESDF